MNVAGSPASSSRKSKARAVLAIRLRCLPILPRSGPNSTGPPSTPASKTASPAPGNGAGRIPTGTAREPILQRLYSALEPPRCMKDLTPRQIVAELDRHIIGQDAAKRAVAVAVRNRWRRQQLDKTFAREVTPKNIIMIGPTGVGKTEIARRLANLVNAPFIKVEASKYTEVGYHGRDVESMIRDLLELAINMVRSEQALVVREHAQAAVEQRLVSHLLGDLTSKDDVPGLQYAGENGEHSPG